MTELLKLAPATAVLLTMDADGRITAEEEVPVALVQRGDHLKVCRLVQVLTVSGALGTPQQVLLGSDRHPSL